MIFKSRLQQLRDLLRLHKDDKANPHSVTLAQAGGTMNLNDMTEKNHASLASVTSDQHHAQTHTHASHTSIGANDHHNQAHDHSASADTQDLAPLTVSVTKTTGNTLVVDTDVLVVDATNNRVGIGTTGPAAKLDILGASSLTMRIVSAAGTVPAYMDGQAYKGIYIATPSGSGDYPGIETVDTVGMHMVFAGNTVGTLSNDDLRILTNSNDRIKITSGGNVGIGKTPTEKLDVAGNIAVSALSTVDGVDISAHDHSGAGQGGTVSHTNLSSIGTNTHAQVDTHLSASNPHSGSAPLASPTFTGTVTAPVFQTLSSFANIEAGATTTIFAVVASSTWLVAITQGGNSWTAVGIVSVPEGSSTAELYKLGSTDAQLQLAVSGLNVQAYNGWGVVRTVSWRAIAIGP